MHIFQAIHKLTELSFRMLRVISNLFKPVLLFLPGLLSLFSIYQLFWNVEQAKDLLIANAAQRPQYLVFLVSFFIFVYVVWYSSHLLLYVYSRKEDAALTDYYRYIPRIIGFLCFSIMWAAVLQLFYIRDLSITKGWAMFYVICSGVFYFLFLKVSRKILSKNIRIVRMIYYSLCFLFLIVCLFCIVILKRLDNQLMGLFYILVLLQLIYVLWVELRHSSMEKTSLYLDPKPRKFFFNGLNLPSNEYPYFAWFNIYSLVAVLFYFACVWEISFAFKLGSLCFIFFVFSVFVGVSNLLSALSIRLGINLAILFLLALVFTSRINFHKSDVYNVRLHEHQHIDYAKRTGLQTYFHNWIERRSLEIDSSKDEFPVFFVLSDGGASRSGYWVASVLGKLQESTTKEFSKHLFCLSGASGGSVGNGTFYSLLMLDKKLGDTLRNYVALGQQFLKNDFLSFTLSRMLGGDIANYFMPYLKMYDRAAALEKSMEYFTDDSVSKMFAAKLSDFVFSSYRYDLPILCINATRMQDGYPAVVCNVNIDSSSTFFNNRVDILNLLSHKKDLNLSTAIVLGARFPFVSPAGNINNQYFVDGGYFDNSGSGIVQEMIRALLIYGRDSLIRKRASKLRFYVIHITNSPESDLNFEQINPLVNDVTAPLQTLISSYGTQTSIMDKRLMQYLKEIYPLEDIADHYFLVPLYKTKNELTSNDPYYDTRYKKEVSYSMNWYISDTTLKRMNNRLYNSPNLDYLIEQIKKRSYRGE